MRPLPILRTTLLVNLVLTLAAMTLAYRALRRADDLSERVITSHRALQAAEETLRRTVDVETGARGFILTHNPADLERFRTGRQFVALTDRMQQVERADRRINWLLVVMTGVATALLTMLTAALVFVTRPGVWRP